MNKMLIKPKREKKKKRRSEDKKRKIKLQYTVLIVLVVVTSFSLAFMSIIRLKLTRGFTEQPNLDERSWHYVLIAEDVDSSFWQEVYSGAKEAALQSDAVVELIGSAQFAPDQSLSSLDRAIASRCDGIATCVVDQKGAVEGINKAIDNNIPVVTMEYDAPDSKRQSFVGVNSFNLGQTFGELLVDKHESGDVVLLVSDDPNQSNIAENLILSGMQNILEAYPDINLTNTMVSRASVFSAQEAIRDLLLEQRPLDTILCLNVQDTLRCVEALVDFNKTDQVSIICYQDNADVLEYVRSGIVYSAISSDAWQMGYESIQALTELKTNNRTSEYIPSKLVIINQDNIDKYYKVNNEVGP